MNHLQSFNWSSIDFSTFFSRNSFRTFYFDFLALLITGKRKAIAKKSAHDTDINSVKNRFILESVWDWVADIMAVVDSLSATSTVFKQLYWMNCTSTLLVTICKGIAVSSCAKTTMLIILSQMFYTTALGKPGAFIYCKTTSSGFIYSRVAESKLAVLNCRLF